MSDHSTESAPTTDCPHCGRTAKDCNDSHAKGWDGCCMGCDGAGRINTHRLRLIHVIPPDETV